MRSTAVRVADLLIALSLATDLGFGRPMEHMLRTTRLALRIGDRIGLAEAELATVYDVSLLTYVGCSVYGDEAARIFGDDIEFRAAMQGIDRAGTRARWFMLRQAGKGSSPGDRVKHVGSLVATNGRRLVGQMANHCAAAGQLADRLALGDAVREGVEQAYVRWDGRGVPDSLAGDQLSFAGRIAHVAEALEMLERRLGVNDAVAVLCDRSGTQFDPQVVDTVCFDTDDLVSRLGDDTHDAVLEAEPIERLPLDDEQLDAALEAIGDFCDLRCTYFAGHSRGTADLAVAAARSIGLGDDQIRLLRRAAHIHEAGRFGVSAQVWNRPGALTVADMERVRLHTYFVERMFNRPEPLRRIGVLAGSHHERTDGSGYHRGVPNAMLDLPARILAAADAYHAMGQERPHRPPLSPAEAERQLTAECRAGRFDSIAVDAVLGVGDDRPSRIRAGGPAGLTARETEVVGMVARGRSNKAIAQALGIKPKTVSNHLERAYPKLGVSNRAAATMKALEFGIVAAGER